MKKLSAILGMLLAFAICGAAQQPRLMNGNVQTSSAANGLEPALRQVAGDGVGPTWIGYAVPLVESSKPRMICCGTYSSGDNSSTCCGGCPLETDDYSSFNNRSGDCTQDTPQSHLVVFLRYSSGHVTRIRAMTPNCAVEAKGLTIRWLNDVRPAESVALLAPLAQAAEGPEHYVADSAIMAIALHADASADAMLARLINADQPEKTRERAAFWIASERGHAGFALLQKLAHDDPSSSFRRKLAFDISISKEPDAVQELIRMAHQDEDGRVRSQAIFWLAQKAGKKVVAEIENAIENDPDTEVKKKAVFALAQMHDDEGVTRLIQVARTNRNREVRRQAIFWLGQSHDPRALQFIEEVLTR